MAKIHDTLHEIKSLSYRQLLDKRTLTCTERIKIESKLHAADEKKAQGIPVDFEWLSKTEYAFRATGIILTAIDNELSFRKNKHKESLADHFMQVAKETLPHDLFESILVQARSVFDGEQSE